MLHTTPISPVWTAKSPMSRVTRTRSLTRMPCISVMYTSWDRIAGGYAGYQPMEIALNRAASVHPCAANAQMISKAAAQMAANTQGAIVGRVGENRTADFMISRLVFTTTPTLSLTPEIAGTLQT